MNKYLELLTIIIGLMSIIMCFDVFRTLVFVSDSYTIIEPTKWIRIIELIIATSGVILLGRLLWEKTKTFK